MFFVMHSTVKFLSTIKSLCIKCIAIAVLTGLVKPVPVPLGSHWQAESQDRWTQSRPFRAPTPLVGGQSSEMPGVTTVAVGFSAF